MTRVDREALKRAIAMAKAEDPGRREQIEAKLADEPWREVAEFAAYCCQCRSLRLKPWQIPPCHASSDPIDECSGTGNVAALALARRLEAAGLSRWEPDPARALAMAEVPPAA